jgi:acyl-CoA reductase-like NAD-dependent aldehyde dehydrogenase
MPPTDLKLFIAGEWTEGTGDGVYELHSPVTGEHIATVPRPSRGDVARAAQAAGDGTEALAAMSAFERAALCHRIADLIEGRVEELARIQTLEQGKPYKAESLPDIEEAAENFRIAAEDVKRLTTDILPSQDINKRILTFRKPVGRWAAITPWNFPLLIPVEYIAPGLASGNALVSKPPEFTPWTALEFARLCEEAGVPRGALSVLPGDGEVGEWLVTSKDIDAIAFTGSSATGERIVGQAGLKRTLMEMSGNGPLIVCGDANVTAAAEAAVFGAYYCAGQVCCATERAIVVDAVHDEFVEATLKAAESSVRLGDPFDDATTMGPLNNEETARKMDRHMADARERGAAILVGGGRAEGFPTPLYYQFTVVDGVDTDSLLSREESFGPVVPIIRARDSKEALEIANRDELGLQAAVFTSSLREAFWYADNLRNGNVVINDTTDYWEAHEPFGGGAGTRTGWGRVGGVYTMLDMTDLRTVVIDTKNVR